MRYLTETKRVNGLGTAHSGTGHFINQRLSAVALIILIPLFLIFTAPLLFQEPAAVKEAFTQSFWLGLITAATLILTALHLSQGLQVVIEDYTEGALRLGLLTAMKVGILALTIAAIWALVVISSSTFT